VPNVRSYSTVIEGWAKAGDAARAEMVFRRMLDQGVDPNVVTYTSLGKVYAKKGNFKRVEELMVDMLANGFGANEYFMCGLFTAYANAFPPEPARAEQAFRTALESKGCGRSAGFAADEFVLSALTRAVGKDRCHELCNELNIPVPRSSRGPRIKAVGSGQRHHTDRSVGSTGARRMQH